MTGDQPSKAQQIFDRVNELVAEGNSKKDAYEAVAKERDTSVNTVRGSYYRHTHPTNGSGSKEPADPIEAAVKPLQAALEQIDRDVEAAKERAEKFQAEYEQLRDSAETRKASLQHKIEVLQAPHEPTEEPTPAKGASSKKS